MYLLSIRYDLLLHKKRITDRLIEIMKEETPEKSPPVPGEIFSVVYPDYETSIILVSTNDMLPSELDRHPENIIGYIVTVTGNRTIEIWDCVVSKTHRRKGVFKAMIKHIMDSNPFTEELNLCKSVWVGIDPKHPLLEHIIKVYSSFNFGNLRLTSESSLGVKTTRQLLEMRWLGRRQPDLEELLSQMRSLTTEN